MGAFKSVGNKMDIDVSVVSFSQIEYFPSRNGEVKVLVNGVDAAEFDVCYLRLVGKRFEDAALLVYYLRSKGVRIVDQIYERDGLIRLPLPKSVETKVLIDAGVSVPKTYFGRTKMMKKKAVSMFGFPFVIKGTMGKQGNAVWSPRTMTELDELIKKFTPLERKGARFLAQEFVKASQRTRVFVLGGKAVRAITRPTRWRRRFLEQANGEFPEGKRHELNPIPKEDVYLALAASKALGIDIGGADVIKDDFTGRRYVLEVNSAPRWTAVKKDTGMDVEREILKYLVGL